MFSRHMLKTSKQVLLFEALKANRCEYVSSLMDQGVAIESSDLQELYRGVSTVVHFCNFHIIFVDIYRFLRA